MNIKCYVCSENIPINHVASHATVGGYLRTSHMRCASKTSTYINISINGSGKCIVDSLVAKEILEKEIDNIEFDSIEITPIELTKAQYEDLPEFGGW